MGSDAWETDDWEKERQEELDRVYNVNSKNIKRARKVLVDYFMYDGCSYDSAVEHANEILPKIIKVLGWKGEEVAEYYREKNDMNMSKQDILNLIQGKNLRNIKKD